MAAPEPEDSDDDMFASAMAFGSETAEAEKEYDKILELLREAEGMKMYCDVYTKLYDTYYANKERYATLMAEMDDVQAKMRKFDATVADYQQEIREANKTIAKLNGDIDEARALADAMHARELMSVESLETLKRTAARLEKELDARKRAGDDEGATSVVKEKEKFEKEKAKLQLELDGTRLRLENAINYQEEMEHRVAVAEETINKQEEQLEEAENQAVRTHRLVDHLQLETSNLACELEVRGNSISTLSEKLSKAEKTIDRRDKTVKELTHKLDFSKQEQESAVQRATTLRFKLDKLQVEHSKCSTDLLNQTKDTKNLQLIARDQKLEIAKYHKQVVQLAKKLQLIEQSKGTIVGERDQLRQQVSVMEREITLNKKEAENNKRIVENANREKEILNKQMQMIQHDAQENLEMMQLQENHRKQQDHELEMNSKQITKQRLIIRQLEKDKDRMLEETIALNEKIDEVADEVRMRLADIVDLKKALREENINNRKLTAALDFTRSERNMLHKNYTEALDEIMDLKQKLKMLAYQIEQLKEDITGKETGLRSCEGLLAKCTKKCESLRMDIQVGHVKLSEARADIAALRQEEARLNRIVQEGDSARQKLVKELEGLMNERDVVGAQLVRRNDEISLLYEKIRILEITLHRGERQYEQRVEDIRLLRLEIIRLRKEKNLLSKGIENMTDLRLEVFNLERELGRERLRVRALEEALETPLNVHRWRKLQGTDPESVHLTQKLRLTQKKVLRQSEMLVMKDRELKETKNLYGAVKDMLALQPSPEIQQTLNRTQRALTQRTSKLKCLVAELQMRERQVSDLRHELDRSTDELNSFKNKYYDIKRALDADEARRLKIPSPTPASPSAIVLA